MYAKQTQTDAVSVKDKLSEDEEEGEDMEQGSKDLQESGFKRGHKDDTIEPEKQVLLCQSFIMYIHLCCIMYIHLCCIMYIHLCCIMYIHLHLCCIMYIHLHLCCIMYIHLCCIMYIHLCCIMYIHLCCIMYIHLCCIMYSPVQFTTPHQLELSSEQVDHIMGSEEFGAFVNRASRLMERAMSDTSDILFDQVINGGKEDR